MMKGLKKIESNTLSLKEYLKKIVGDDILIFQENDPLFYVELCNEICVVPEDNICDICIHFHYNGSSFRDVINRLVANDVLNNIEWKNRNILSLGYRRKRQHSPVELRNNYNVECHFVNTIHSFFMSAAWSFALKRLGEDVIKHILSRPIFLPHENDTYIQLSGPSLKDFIYHNTVKEESKWPQIICRKKMFYNDKRIPPKFSKRHPLCALKCANWSQLHDYVCKEVLKGNCNDLQLPSNTNQDSVGLDRIQNLQANAKHGTLTITDIFRVITSRFNELNIENSFCKHILQSKDSDKCRKVKKNANATVTVTTPVKPASDSESDSSTSGRRHNVGNTNVISSVASFRKVKRGCRGGKGKRKRTEQQEAGKVKVTDVVLLGGSSLKRSRLSRSDTDASDIGKTKTKESFSSTSFASQDICSSEIAMETVAEESQTFPTQVNSNSVPSTYPLCVIDGTFKARSVPPQDIDRKRRRLFCINEVNDQSYSQHDTTNMRSQTQSPTMRPLCNKVAREPTSQSEVEKSMDKTKKSENVFLNYFSLAHSQDSVVEYVSSVCRQIFPRIQVWGSRHNQNVFMSNICRFIRLGRHDCLSASYICGKMRTSDMAWLQTTAESCRLMPVTKQKILECFMEWIFTQIIIPLISASFYVTEGEGLGNEVLYYTKKDWRTVSAAGEAQMNQNFKLILPNVLSTKGKEHAIPPQNLLSQTKSCNTTMSTSSSNALVYYPSVRFVPKSQSVRAITNLNRRYEMLSKIKNSAPVTGRTNSSKECSRLSAHSGGTLCNGDLKNCFQILKHVYEFHKELLHCNNDISHTGFGVFGVDDVYHKIKDYKLKLLHIDLSWKFACSQHTPSLAGNKRKFYIATFDLEKCFDRVDTFQLFDILSKMINGFCISTKDGNRNVEDIRASYMQYAQDNANDLLQTLGHLGSTQAAATACKSSLDSYDAAEDIGFSIHKHYVTHFVKSLERTVTKCVHRVTLDEDVISLREAASELCKKYKNCVITDGVVHAKVMRNQLLQLIKTHLFGHVVHIAGSDDLYLQKKGIPQGSILSPLLCNIYFDNVESNIFTSQEIASIGLDTSTTMLRLMDDYILISDDKHAVMRVLQKVQSCFIPYGGKVNPLKTRVNFDVDIESNGDRITLKRASGNVITWCGLDLHCDTLEITPSFLRMMERPLAFSVSKDCIKMGRGFRKIIKSFLKSKCHPIILDCIINDTNTIITSIYSLFSISCLRSMTFLCRRGGTIGLNIESNFKFIVTCIKEAIVFGSYLIESRQTKRKPNQILTQYADLLHDHFDGKDKMVSQDNTRDKSKRSAFPPINSILWLGYEAFINMLDTKPCVFKSVSKKLQSLQHDLTISQSQLHEGGNVAISTELLQRSRMIIMSYVNKSESNLKYFRSEEVDVKELKNY